MTVRIVTKEREVELTFDELHITPTSGDAAIIKAAERSLDTTLKDYMVTKNGDNVIVSATPIYG